MNLAKSYVIASVFSIINGLIIGIFVGNSASLLHGTVFAIVLAIILSVFYWIIILSIFKKTKELKPQTSIIISICGIIFVNTFTIIMANWIWSIGIIFLMRIILYFTNFITFCGMLYFGSKLLQENNLNILLMEGKFYEN